MQKKYKRLFAKMLIFCLLLCSSQSVQVRAVELQGVERIPIEQYLSKAAIALDCYFTIEGDSSKLQKQTVFATAYVSNDSSPTSLRALIQKLKIELPSVVVKQNEKNPAVINLIESADDSVNKLPLSWKVSLRFSGVLMELPSALSQKTSTIILSKNSNISTQMYEGVFTNVNFVATNESVRNVLTN